MRRFISFADESELSSIRVAETVLLVELDNVAIVLFTVFLLRTEEPRCPRRNVDVLIR